MVCRQRDDIWPKYDHSNNIPTVSPSKSPSLLVLVPDDPDSNKTGGIALVPNFHNTYQKFSHYQ